MSPFRFLPLLALSLMLTNMYITPAIRQSISYDDIQQKIQSACSFLQSLYNPVLHLVRETPPSSHIYHIASDNLLAQKALASCDPILSQHIQNTITNCCANLTDGMHESLLGETIPLPIRTPTIHVIANSTSGKLFQNITPTAAGGNYTILTEQHNGPAILTDCTYGDVTVYTLLELKRENNHTRVQHQYDCLNQMSDGHGIVDEPYKDGDPSEHGIYQTLKTALYLYTLHLQHHRVPAGLEDTLLRTQGPDGGFHTGYDQAGTYAGTLENAETTSIVIITLSSNIPSLVLPAWIIIASTVSIATLVIGVAVILIVVFLDKRKSGTSRLNAGGKTRSSSWLLPLLVQ